jgi:putative transcriptional regulator
MCGGSIIVMIRIHLGRLLGERKLKMSHLSQQTGISKNALSDLYYEKTKGIQFDTLEKICAALNCKVADVLEYITDEQREEKAE